MFDREDILHNNIENSDTESENTSRRNQQENAIIAFRNQRANRAVRAQSRRNEYHEGIFSLYNKAPAASSLLAFWVSFKWK